MKKNNIYILALSVVGMTMFSCTSESPFMNSGEGTVTFKTEMHSDVALATRAIDGETLKNLEDNLTVYIETNKGVIRKYNGKSELPGTLTLNSGDYAIEGWTGDSVSASYDKKFYRGYQKFSVVAGQVSEVNFNVNIANVIVSVDAESLKQGLGDFKVSFSHSRGLLEFNNETVEEGKKGYFMMPSSDNDIYYKVELKSQLGEDILKEGVISDVERAHEYSIRLLADFENDKGAGLVKLEILDIPVLDKKLNVYPAPTFYSQIGESLDEFDIENTQIDCSEGIYNDVRLRVVGYGGISNLALNFPSPFEDMEYVNGVNLRNNSTEKENAVVLLKNNYINYGSETGGFVYDDTGTTSVQEVWLTFTSEFFRNLPESPTEYVIEVTATDGLDYPASNSLQIRIANSESAVDKRLVETLSAPATYDSKKPMAILATSATLELVVKTEEAFNYGIEYRKKNSQEEFKKIIPTVQSQSLQTVSLTLTGLEPDTEYEYRAFCDGYIEQNVKTFITEAPYMIPNSDLTEWSYCNDVVNNTLIPNANGIRSFWDTGNHGSMSLNKNITVNDDSFISGNTVAKLQSQFVGVSLIGKFAAGNLFVGEFIQAVGMKGAQLKFGHEYNGSHPSALKVKINYQPGTVDYSENSAMPKGNTDQGQIYVAIASQQAELNTAEGSYFDETKDYILGYGQLTWDSKVGENNQLVTVTIPIDYKEAAKTNKVTHIIIVCSASKYGDYFTGSSNSVMYVDDFELLYDEVQFQQ